MPKISKNIKKIRTELNLTQDALAEKMHMTRQAISNWENDKTKPDVEALEKLAEIFDVDMEELIYGEKREKVIIPDKTKEKNRIKIILAIAGCLFIGSGLTLVFFGLWQKLPLPVQTVFSFVPILIGQVVAIYTFLKKKTSAAWREGAAILWGVGIVATVALLNDIYSIDFGYINCLAIDAFFIIPVMFLLDAVSPLVFFLYSAIHIGAVGLWQYLIISFVIYGVGILFTAFLSRDKDEPRGKFAQWITVLAGIPLLWIYNLAASQADILLDSNNVFFAVYLAMFLCLYIFSAENLPYSLPYKPVSIVGMCIVTSYLATELYNGFFADNNMTALIINTVFCIILPVVAAFIKRESFEDNLDKFLISALPFAVAVINFTMIFMDEFGDRDNGVLLILFYALKVAIRVVAVTFGVALIYVGVKELRLFLVNMGLLTAFYQIMNLLYSGIFDISYFSMGAVLVLFGTVIIAINWKMLSVKKKLKENAEGGGEHD